MDRLVLPRTFILVEIADIPFVSSFLKENNLVRLHCQQGICW